MLTLSYLQNSIFCPITLFQVVRFELFLHKQGLFFQIIIFSTNNLILSSKFNVLSHNYVLSSQNWKIHSWAGVIFFQIIILSTNNPMLSSKLNVLSHNSIPSCQMWKIHSWAGVIFPDNCFEYHQSMLSSKLNIRTQNSVLSCQMWKIPSQTGIAFMRQSFWIQTTLCYLQNWMCCPNSLSDLSSKLQKCFVLCYP